MDVTIIIPIIDINGNESNLNSLANAIKSAKDNKIVVIGKQEDIDAAKNLEYTFTTIVNDGDTSFCGQVNKALESVNTKYFSILEFDDEYTPMWFTNVEKYMKYIDNDIFGFFPLVEVMDSKSNNGMPIGYNNEAYLATSFSEELGYIDLEGLKNYLNNNPNGAVFKTDAFKELGGLKASMKLSFWYEFLLRACYYKKIMYVIPKVGYKHYINRDGSLSETYAKTLSTKEADWWIDLALKEYFFKTDRNKTYEEE